MGLLLAFLLPVFSDAWMSFLVGKLFSDPWSSPLVEALRFKSPILIGLWIFVLNFALGSVLRFIVTGILFYCLPLFFGVTTGFGFGFVVGAPSFVKIMANLPPIGLAFFLSYLVFESSGYIVACAIGYRIGRESQKGLGRKDLLKIVLIAPVHLREKPRRLVLKRELKASLWWLLACAILILLNSTFETATLVFFR